MDMITYRSVLPTRLPKFDYREARTVEEVCSLLAQYGGSAKLIAGGTDLMVQMRKQKLSPQHLINIKTIPGLDYIRHDGKVLKIGAAATLIDVASSPIVKNTFPAIACSTSLVGTQQTRNVATVGGNLCNASPSADTAPSLIALGATVRIQGTRGERVVALEDFFKAPGVTVLQADEMLVEIQVPDPFPYTRAVYLKLPARTAIDLAVVGVAALLTLSANGGEIVDARIALGAVAPTPMRARRAEAILKGRVIEDGLIEGAAQAAAEECKPITDVRGSALYRREMVRVLTGRALRSAGA